MTFGTALGPLSGRAFLRALFATAIPSAFQHFAFSAQQIVDTVMIAHLGDASIAALSLCGAAFFVVTSILFGVVMAAGALISQRFGAGDEDGTRIALALGLLVSQGLAIIAAIVFVFFPEWVMKLGPQSQDVRSAGVAYLRIAGWSLLAWPLIVGVGNALNMTGRASLSMALTVGFVVTAILANYCLIFGFGPIPAMGIRGAAFGTLAANIVFLLIYIVLLRFRLGYLLLQRKDITTALSHSQIWNFGNLSLPLAINGALWSGGLFGYQVIFGYVGELGLAAFGLLTPIITLYLTLFNGLATGAGAIVGQSLGRGDHLLAWQYGIRSVKIAAVCAIAMSLALLPILHLAAFLYPSISPELSREFMPLLYLCIMLIWTRGINIVVINGVLRAGGDNKAILKIDTISSWGIGIPISLLAAVVLGLPAPFVYVASVTEEMTKCALALFRMNQKVWCRTL
jgi:putative MATE family efflux protein